MTKRAVIWIALVCGAALCLVLALCLTERRQPQAPARPALAEVAPPSAPDVQPVPSLDLFATKAAPLPAQSAAAPTLDEASLMLRLRALEDSDPSQALDLARDGDRRFPNGRDSAERAMIEVKSLAREGRLSEARGAAEVMVNKYPGTHWALEVERHTGAHPRVNR
ncbi:MAG: hypothetical protein ABSC94_27290 [Polyangiaceae bacterium]